jgi:type IV secretory pathway TraG/TraD family ATPase VirD4
MKSVSDAALTNSLSASDFKFADLKKRVVPVYVVLPINYLDVCEKYFRLIVASALSEFAGQEKGPAVLALSEELRKRGLI